jgi:phosphohistidine phosphatase
LKEGLIPQVIISSSAVRAYSTAEKVAKACGYEDEILVDSSLYGSGYTEYLNVLINQDEDYYIVMLVGHNPSLEQLLEILTGRMVTMPSCTVACIRLPIKSWKKVSPQTKGELLNLWRPKDLRPDE